MKNLKTKSKSNVILSKTLLVAMLIITIVSAVVMLSFNQVFALGSSNGAVQAGGGAELWNNVTNTFNPNVVNDIKSKLFGTTDPVAYIESNYVKEEYTLSQGKVVPAKAINKKVGNAQDGMVVTLGGKKWMVASLTLADTPNHKNSVIMTLYLAQNEGTSIYSDFPIKTGAGVGSDSVNFGANMYSSSTVRNHLLTADNWSLFSSGYFAENYLVQPKYINYQRNLTRNGRDDGTDLKNDTLGDAFNPYKGNNYGWDASGTWGSKAEYGTHVPYDENTTVNGYRYNDWGEDYIWLPSMTETGALKEEGVTSGGSYIDDECVWKLTQNQRKHSGSTWSWLRSGNYNFYNLSYVLGSSGAYSSNLVSNDYGVRPALHLNLSSAVLGTASGIAPTNESGYDYQTIDKNNIRQNFGALNNNHSASVNGRNVLGKISPNTKLATFIANLENSKSSIKVYDSKNNLIYDKGVEVVANQIIGTGYRVELYNGTTATDIVYLSVLGDVNGDGRITASDVMYLRQIASDKDLFNNLYTEYKLASMVINKGTITSADSEILIGVMDYKLRIEIFY